MTVPPLSPCTFDYKPRWPDFVHLLDDAILQDQFSPKAALLKEFTAIMEMRDRQLEDHLQNRPCGSCDYAEFYPSADVVVANNGFSQVLLDSTEVSSGIATLAAGSVVITQAADYLVGGVLGWAANGTGGRYMQMERSDFLHHGTGTVMQDNRAAGMAANTTEQHMSRILSLNAGDQLSLFGSQNSGAALHILSGADTTPNFNSYIWLLKLCTVGTPIATGGG